MSVLFPPLRRGLVAILRGIRPDEIEAAVDALLEAGFEAIEVPLNSPDPFASIERAARRAPPSAWIGAGTVLDVADVDRLADAGGRLVVSPNIDPAVVKRAGERGMVTMPGVMTATEAFLALRLGASALKLFPASLFGPAGIQALKAVLPGNAVVAAVGGVGPDDFATYAEAGVRVFGLGSSLYAPGFGADEIAARARRAVAAFDALGGKE